MITTISRPHCPVCESKGTICYTDLVDYLYKTPGVWSMRRCKRVKCGTHWLDPAPAPEALDTLYVDYTTHSKPESRSILKPRTLFQRLTNTARSSVQTKLGYQAPIPKIVLGFFLIITRLHPGWYDQKLNELCYTTFIPNGRLLDVGCGNGSALATLRARGWNVRGIDFDPKAVAVAKMQGFDVSVGSLAQHHFPDDSFDTVLMSHVIEHVADPITTLSECHRILRPGGHLIVVTPNAASRGHTKYAECWRGLEVPRHLQVFTPTSLADAARRAGFRTATGTTSMQGMSYLPEASRACKKTGRFDILPSSRILRLVRHIRLYFAGLRFQLFPGSEETVLLRCTKEQS